MQSINYSDEMMEMMMQEWSKIDRAYLSVYRRLELNERLNDLPKEEYQDLMEEFLNSMANNFNTSLAITELYNLIKNINRDLRSKDLNIDALQKEYMAFKDMLEILGLIPTVKPLTKEEKELVLNWQKARNDKDFNLADELRKAIVEKGIEL